MTTPASNDDSQHDADGLSRRSLLTATAGVTGAVGTSGCIRQVRSVVNRDEIDQLSLSITTVPADGDRESIQLARDVATALETVGIDVSIDMRSHEEFLRAILINQEFDLYVGRHPGGTDPAFLYEALHSRYADEAGWQNPFGYANLAFDEFLENQRTADGTARREAVRETLEVLAVEQPFVPICVPDEYRLVRTDRFDGWENGHLATRLGYLGLETVDEDENADATDDEETPTELRAAHVDARPSQNLNPLAVEYRNRGTVVDLLYDSLAVEPISSRDFDSEFEAFETEGEDPIDAPADAAADTDADDDAPDEYSPLEPWIAESWEWDGDRMLVDLREDCRFHDDEPLTAADVAFTYRFLADTTLGDGTVPAPSPRHRGLVSAVDIDGLDVIDDTRLEIPVETGRAAGERALMVPILPEHVWRERSAAADIPGFRVADGTTEALVTDNVPPIGSGPYRFASRTDREHVTLERFDEHFTLRPTVDRPAPTADRVRIQIDPRSTSAIELVESDDADVTSTTLESYVMDDVLERANASGDDGFPEDVTLIESRSWAFYHLGFNTRKAPFSNPRFRRVVARVLDKEWLVESVFDGHARPIAAPVIEEWTPASLEWDGEDPETPFLGTDGEIDVGAARRAFEDAGFRYDAAGRLRVRR